VERCSTRASEIPCEGEGDRVADAALSSMRLFREIE